LDCKCLVQLDISLSSQTQRRCPPRNVTGAGQSVNVAMFCVVAGALDICCVVACGDERIRAQINCWCGGGGGGENLQWAKMLRAPVKPLLILRRQSSHFLFLRHRSTLAHFLI